MSYSVVWRPPAFLELERMAMGMANAQPLRDAASHVDFTLRRTPHDMGESRAGTERIWYWDILCVFYDIDERAKRVSVLFVGPARRR